MSRKADFFSKTTGATIIVTASITASICNALNRKKEAEKIRTLKEDLIEKETKFIMEREENIRLEHEKQMEKLIIEYGDQLRGLEKEILVRQEQAEKAKNALDNATELAREDGIVEGKRLAEEAAKAAVKKTAAAKKATAAAKKAADSSAEQTNNAK